MISLFDTDSEDDSLDGADTSQSEDGFVVKHIPMNEAISSVPDGYAQLLEVLLPRFQPKYNIKGVTIEDQESLAKILIGELASQFSVIQCQIDDPFLSSTSNKELHRLVYVEVASILETLFNSFLAKASRINSEGALNFSAQLSCLRAELTLVANKRLNIPLIRRKILTKLQKGSTSAIQTSDIQVEISHGADDLNKIHKMQLNFPTTLQSIGIDAVPIPNNVKNTDDEILSDAVEEGCIKNNENKPEQLAKHDVIGKVPSEPCLPTNSLLYDLGMQQLSGQTKQQFLGLWESPSLDVLKDLLVFGHDKEQEEQSKTSLGGYSDRILRNDVEALSMKEVPVLEQGPVSGDLTPLLAAHTFTSIKKRPVGDKTDYVPAPETPRQELLYESLPLQIPQTNSINSSFHNTNTDYIDVHVPCDSSFHDSDGIKSSLSQALSQTSNDVDFECDASKSVSVQHIDEEQSLPDMEQDRNYDKKQPDVLTMALPQNNIGRASNVRVNGRSPVFSLRLQSCPAVYNELANHDLDAIALEQLDSNLKEGHDIHEIYEELSQTLSKDHLTFDKDPVLEPYIDEAVNMSTVYASSSLHHRKSTRIVSESLVHAGFPPWRGKSRREWLASKPEEISSTSRGQKKGSKPDTVSANDYFKFVANIGSDYLGVIHHMYDSSGSDSEDEQKEEEKKRKLQELHDQLLMKEKNRYELWRQKNLYTPGEWNVNAVLMGGLGNDPEAVPKEQGAPALNWSVVQARLKYIWARLQLSDDDQFNMAFKFSRPKFHLHVEKVLTLWESCCDIVEKREVALKYLGSFESHASDPTRHFCKSSSLMRLREARQRASLHKDIEAYDREIVKLATQLSKYRFTLKYMGRDYVEKMRLDRIELLYFLHQQRRQTVLQPALKLLNNSLPIAP